MRAFALCLMLTVSPSFAHELWIEPLEFQVSTDTTLQAHLVNGEEFEGVELSYLPRNFSDFVIFAGTQRTNVTGRIGDTPALQMDPIQDGLHVAAYISNPSTINYKTWEKFQKFVDHKDLGDARAAHDARGLPAEGFDEAYRRFSKSLIGVGSSEGADRRLGMETEIVALNNPYVEGDMEVMGLQLFYQRDVRADEQIEILEKAPDGTVNIFLVRTNQDGVASVPVKSGHLYMADAVVLREPSERLASATGAVWETLWANLTWAMP